MKRKALYSLFVAILLFSFASLADAQLANDDIGVDVLPEQPAPLSSTTIKLTSYSINMAAADVSWTVGGKLVLSGVGKSTYTFTTGGIGSQTTILAVVTPLGGLPVQKTIVIRPMGIDLIWQAVDSTVPPLYRGKALPSSGAKIKVVAMPQIIAGSKTYAQGDLVYTWKQNYDLAGDEVSGYGKSAFTFEANYLNQTERVDVKVENRDGSLAAAMGMDIRTQNPKILWYSVSPLYGPLFEKALSNGYEVSGSEQTFLAEPFYFSAPSLTSSMLNYTWSINGDSTTTPIIPNTLALHRDSATAGKATLGLTVESTKKIFQTAKSLLSLSLK